MKTGTIPRFPRFVRVGFTVRQEINEFTGRFKSYSDFNFVNLLSWNNNDDMAVSWLNANLVFRFRDYTSGAVFYSFIGNNEVVQTAQALLDFAGQQGHDVSLKLIPEDCVSDIAKSNNLLVSEDPDNQIGRASCRERV